MRGDRKRITHKMDPRAGYVGSRTNKDNNRQYKGPDRKLAMSAEIDDLIDQELHEGLDHDVAEDGDIDALHED